MDSSEWTRTGDIKDISRWKEEEKKLDSNLPQVRLFRNGVLFKFLGGIQNTPLGKSSEIKGRGTEKIHKRFNLTVVGKNLTICVEHLGTHNWLLIMDTTCHWYGMIWGHSNKIFILKRGLNICFNCTIEESTYLWLQGVWRITNHVLFLALLICHIAFCHQSKENAQDSF